MRGGSTELNSCSMKGLKKGMPIYPALTGRGARIRSSMSFLGTQGLRPAWAIWDFASRNKNQSVTQEYPKRKMNKGFGMHVTKESWKVTDWDRNQFHSIFKEMAIWLWELNSIFCKLHLRTYPMSHPSNPWKLCKFNMWMLLLFGDPTVLPAEDMCVFILGEENFETVQQWLYLKETGTYCPQVRVHRIKWMVLACQVVSILSLYNYVWLCK